MARKRGRSVRKSSSRSRRSRSSRSTAPRSRVQNRRIAPGRNNVRLVANNLIIFFLLFLISIILAQIFSYSIVLENLFAIFSMAFAFITIAFLITLLVFFFLKILHKR